MVKKKLFLALSFLVSCAPSSVEDLRWEGEAQTRKLCSELREIETKEDLQKAIPRLRKRFNQIAALLVEIKKYPSQDSFPSAVSEELFIELARLYEMPNGREYIEMAQSEAVRRLDVLKVKKN